MAQIPSLPPTGFFSDMVTGFRRICETINLLLKVVGNIFTSYSATFQSGAIAFGGPDGGLQGSGSFQLGYLLPNASGIPSPGIFIGGAGATQVVYITDEQIAGIKGINVIREAGDANSSPGTDDGGDLLDFAGGTLSGNGGTAKYQAGTSVHARAGDVVIHGGNSTNGTPGNAVIMGGETGTVAGSSVLLYMIKPTGAPGFGDVRIVKGDGGGPPGGTSTILIQFLSNGEIYLTNSGTGAGLAGQPLVSGAIGAPAKWQTGFTGAKVIGGQTYTWASGILISVV